MNAVGRHNRVVLEESPEYFWERFSQYAQTWTVSPEPLGSPMLEVLTPLGPLFVFDRTLLPFSGSESLLILHGQVEHWETTQSTSAVQHLGGGRYRLTGLVEAVLDAGFYVLKVEGSNGGADLRLLLAAQDLPEPGSRVTVTLAPPLMAFRPDSFSR